MTEIVVRSERVVLPGGMRPAAVHVRDGRIAAIAEYDAAPANVRQVDAGACMLLPGLVDTHVHMNDPGRADWEGADHATRAAAAGGVTTIVDMPLNSIPPTTTMPGLDAKRRALEGRCAVDVAFWGGVVPGNTSDLEGLVSAGVRGFKCFLCPSGVPEFEHVTEADLRAAMPEIARLGVPLLVHAELPSHLVAAGATDRRRYDTWLATRPSAAEERAIDFLIALAEEYRTRVHVVHLTSTDALPAVRSARARGVPISVETCPHYLTFAAEDIADGATAFKCAPPIRAREQRERLWEALRSGEIDLIASDHSPAPPAAKCLDTGDFLAAWGGVASLEIGLAAVWTGASARGIPVERTVEWMSLAPARLAGLTASKGSIAPGRDADLVIWDPDAEMTVDASTLHHRHPVTPYAGMQLRGAVRLTMVRGEIVYRDGELLSETSGSMIGSAR